MIGRAFSNPQEDDMRRIIAAISCAAGIVAFSASLGADTKTVTGEVIDVQCQAKQGDKGTGEGHVKCAMTCARKGAPMGILASDGVYIITGDMTADNNKKLLDFVAKKVEAKGEVSEQDGKKTINVSSMTAK
jgi:hypothetical protein